MGTLGIFVDRQTLSYSKKLSILMRFRDVAESLGHRSYFIFPVELKKITKLDGLLIRSRTDPLNVSYVAARMATLHGIQVIDNPDAIRICSDKVNMYLHLMRAKVPIPHTEILVRKEVLPEDARGYFEEMGTPVVLKEPSTSYSNRVKRAHRVEDFVQTARAYLKMADELVVQEYIESEEDWRIGVLNGRFLFASRYISPRESDRVQAIDSEEIPYFGIEKVRKDDVPIGAIELAIQACHAIGSGLFSVDIKERQGKMYVIEVNDNPSLESGEEDLYPDIFERIIVELLE
jgi:glutathione synthase/RimK-type ligase-like ATP-grasp enzyme